MVERGTLGRYSILKTWMEIIRNQNLVKKDLIDCM